MPKTHADGTVSNADIVPAALGTVPNEQNLTGPSDWPVIHIETGNAEWDEYLTDAALQWLAGKSSEESTEGKVTWQATITADATVTHADGSVEP